MRLSQQLLFLSVPIYFYPFLQKALKQKNIHDDYAAENKLWLFLQLLKMTVLGRLTVLTHCLDRRARKIVRHFHLELDQKRQVSFLFVWEVNG